MVKFRSRHRVKKVLFFLLKNSTFHLNRTLFFEEPNKVIFFFAHFINITFFPEKKRQGPNYVKIKNLPFKNCSRN